MNRRKPIKKDSFAILSTRNVRWLKYLGLVIVVTVASIWIFQLLDNAKVGEGTVAMAGEDVVAVLAMIGIPLAIFFALLKGFEKITGYSALDGVEWVGKNTLIIIDWCADSVKNLLGGDVKKTNQRFRLKNKRVKKDKPVIKDKPNSTLIETIKAALLKPTFLKPREADSEPVISAFHDEPLATTVTDEVLHNVLSSDTDKLLPSETVKHSAGSPLSEAIQEVDATLQLADIKEPTEVSKETSADEFATEEVASFIPEQVGLSASEPVAHFAEQEMIAPEVHSEPGLNEAMEKDALQNEADDVLMALHSIEDTEPDSAENDQSVDERVGEADIDIFSQALLHEVGTENTTAGSAENGSDFILDALQAVKDDETDIGKSNEAVVERISAAEIDDISQALWSELGTKPSAAEDSMQKQSELMSKALHASEDQPTDPVAVNPVVHVEATQLEANEEITENENSAAHPSMLDQAEQTAANIISSFSARLSRSFRVQQKTAQPLPAIELLQSHQQSVRAYSAEELDTMSRSIERVLNDYKVSAEVVGAYPGPIITRFELTLAPGVKVSRVSGLAKDLARAMLVTSVRVVEIIEGTPYIGLEIPNQERELVSFREIISSTQFQQAKSPLTLALGKDVSGQAVVSDLAKMPHLLVAGTTGSGKSVAINTMILSMLYKATPDQVRMIMVDPKMLELSVYEGIPHLLTPVVTDMKEAQNALRWAVAEMERRYKLMSKVGVRNLEGFNQKIRDAESRGEPIRDPLFQLIEPLAEGETFPVLTSLPSIVIVIDELADMMMIVGKKVEELIARLAQKARAAGIHLILATQRPSVDVLTGLIKANVPTRISFQVSSRIDSRTILDQGGAEALLGNGDMLFLPSGTSVPTRSHGAFVDDDEVHAVVDYLKSLGGSNYLPEITRDESTENTANATSSKDEVDVLYNEVVSFVMETGRASISSVQRRFKIGYNRAARMIDQMEEENIISEPEGNGSRRVLDRE